MDLSQFVTQTLLQIQEGVQEAIRQAGVKGLNGAINPIWGDARQYDAAYVRDVEFDVAVTVSDKSSGSAEAGINVWPVRLGGDASKSAENSHVSRIQFSVPIVAPATTVRPPDKS